MKFTADRVALYSAFRTAAKIIPANCAFESIKGLLLEVFSETGLVCVTGTDIRTGIQKRVACAEIGENGAMIVPAVICDVLRLMNGETVCFETDFNGQLKVRSGSCEYLLPVRDVGEYPKAEFAFPEQMVNVTGLNVLVRKTSFAAETRPDTVSSVIQAVELTLNSGQSTATATDGNRMMSASADRCADGTLHLLIHNKALQTLNSLVKTDETLFCGVSKPYAVFFTQDMIFATMLMQGSFPDMQQIIKRVETVYTAVVQAKELSGAIGTATACQLSGDDSCVNIKITADRVIVSAEAYQRSSVIPVGAASTVPTDDIGFYYAPRYITEFLSLTSGQLSLNIDRRGFLRLETGGMKYVVCPRKKTAIRIPEKKMKKEESEAKEKKPRKKAVKKSAVKAA